MQYELILTGKFKKSLKLAKKRGLDLKLLDKVITMLQNDIPLEEKYRDHELKGKYQGVQGMSHSAGLVIDLSEGE